MAGPRGFAILLTALPNRVAMPAAAYLAQHCNRGKFPGGAVAPAVVA
jgi:hypothetical protein